MAQHIGRECAKEALSVAGTDPTDREGESLLPEEPMPGDWSYFEQKLADWKTSGEITDEERDEFESEYKKVISHD